MESVLITGGAGFIGSNFVRTVLAHTQLRIVVVDKLTYAGSLANLADLIDHPRFTFAQADIGDGASMRALLSTHRPRWVVNFAAESHVDRSIDGPRAFIDTNIVGTFELLEATRSYLQLLSPDRRRGFRYLQVSTDEVYGSLGPDDAFRETTPYSPNSPYAASKAAADHLVRAYRETYGVPTLLTNCSNNYGPYQFPEKLIPLMVMNALDARTLPIYGDGGNVRDWLHVEDHCEAILRVLQRGTLGESYNIGGNSERTNLDVVDTLCAVLEELAPAWRNAALTAQGVASYRNLRRFVADRPGHDRRYAIDATKIRTELGWVPRHDFTSGLRETVAWYLNHRDWCSAVQDKNYGRERLGLAARRVAA